MPDLPGTQAKSVFRSNTLLLRVADDCFKCDQQFPACGQCSKHSRTCQYPPSKMRKLQDARFEPLVQDEEAETFFAGIPGVDDSLATSPYSSDVSSQAAAALVQYGLPLEVAKNGWSHFDYAREVKRDRMPKANHTPKKKSDWNIEDVSHIWMPPVSAEDSLRARYLELVDAKPSQWHPGFLWGNWLKLVALRLGRSSALDDATLCFIAGCFAHQNRTSENMKVARMAYGRALCSIQRALAEQENDMAVSSETIAATKFLTGFEVSS